jgi:hypothetical protein
MLRGRGCGFGSQKGLAIPSPYREGADSGTPPLGSILNYGLFGYGRSFRNVDRELEQDYDQPKSVVFAELKPKGTIPGMRIIFYMRLPWTRGDNILPWRSKFVKRLCL